MSKLSTHNKRSVSSWQQGRRRQENSLWRNSFYAFPFLVHKILTDWIRISRFNSFLSKPLNNYIKVILFNTLLFIMRWYVAAALTKVSYSPTVWTWRNIERRIVCIDGIFLFEWIHWKIFIIWWADMEYKNLSGIFNEVNIVSYLKHHDWSMIYVRFWQKVGGMECFDFFFLHAQDFLNILFLSLLGWSKKFLIFQISLSNCLFSLLMLIFLFNSIVRFLIFFAKYLLRLNFSSSLVLTQSNLVSVLLNCIHNDGKVQITLFYPSLTQKPTKRSILNKQKIIWVLHS